MAVLVPWGEDTGAAMWQFWGRGVRIRGLLCGSFGAGYGGCYVAVLGPLCFIIFIYHFMNRLCILPVNLLALKMHWQRDCA